MQGGEKDLTLSLGKVNYTARVVLNGEQIATLVFPPYECKIPQSLLKKSNTLSIFVSNTSANEYAYTHEFDGDGIADLGPYRKKADEFHKTVIESGLIGPVKIKLKKD